MVDTDTYYIKDLSTIKFEVILPGNRNITSYGDKVEYDIELGKYIYEIN